MSPYQDNVSLLKRLHVMKMSFLKLENVFSQLILDINRTGFVCFFEIHTNYIYL